MTPEQFSLEIQPYLSSIKKLADSDEAKKLKEYSYRNQEDEQELMAKEFIAKAQQLNVPARFWFLGETGHYSRDSIFNAVLRRSSAQRAIKLLAAHGASPWTQNLREGKHSFSEPTQVAHLCFPDFHGAKPMGTRRAALSQALSGLGDLPDALAAKFIAALSTQYKSSTASSSATSSGVMGRNDKNAKVNAQIAIENEAPLLALAAHESTGLHERLLIESMLTDAKARLAAKSKKGDDAFDPEKLKKSLTDEQRGRLRTLNLMAENCRDDSDAMQVLLDATPWLAQHPQALCINIRSSASVAWTSLANDRLETLRTLDKIGANLWLAAAQGGEGNACLWACNMMAGYRRNVTDAQKVRQKQMLELISRMIAYGAFLDGAEDPISHSVTKCDEALQSIKGQRRYNSEGAEQNLLGMRSHIESLALAELLSGRGDGEGAPPEEPPKRKSRSL